MVEAPGLFINKIHDFFIIVWGISNMVIVFNAHNWKESIVSILKILSQAKYKIFYKNGECT